MLLSSEYLEKFHKSDTVEYLLTRVDTVIKFVKSYFQIDMTESMRQNIINMFINCEDVTMNSIKGTV